MTYKLYAFLVFLLLLAVANIAVAGEQDRDDAAADADVRPSVLLILADDLGYSDPGCYGGEIKTPNLDRLAVQGIRFTDFYNTARCWPTRSSIMSGYYPQQIGRDSIPGIKGGGHGGQRPDWAILLPEMLKRAGYETFQSGKWHIDGSPIEGGFDHSYHLADHGRFFSPQRHFLDGEKLPPVERGTDYYSTTKIADYAIDWISQNQQAQNESPFFCFVAFTAPHFPLHALPEDIEKYVGVYDEGWESVRAARWDRIQNGSKIQSDNFESPGFLQGNLSAIEPDIGPPYDFPDQLALLGPGEVNRPLPWKSLNEEQKKFQIAKMQIHAAMVDRMDQEIGRLLTVIPDNTIVMFLSDNGASAEIMVRDDGHDPAAVPGSADSHLCLGPGWSSVCNTPFRRHKTWVHEGGCATPLIVRWPEHIKNENSWCRTPGHVIDIVPTILELCCPDLDIRNPDAPVFPGVSFARALVEPDSTDSESTAPDPTGADPNAVDERAIWFAHDGHRALRRGNWKLVAAKDQPWELFDPAADRAETNNLAGSNPETVSELEAIWQTMANEFAVAEPEEQDRAGQSTRN